MINLWNRTKAWFKDSVTILWARIQYVGGILGAGIIVAFSNYDFAQLASLDLKSAFKILVAMSIGGILTEFARRRTL
jgi:hypothetical protein